MFCIKGLDIISSVNLYIGKKIIFINNAFYFFSFHDGRKWKMLIVNIIWKGNKTPFIIDDIIKISNFLLILISVFICSWNKVKSYLIGDKRTPMWSNVIYLLLM